MAYNSYFFYENNISLLNSDTLYLNLFFFKNRRQEAFNEKEKQCIYDIKEKEINDAPIIGSFCKSKCTLEDVKFCKYHNDYRFSFEKESIKFNEGRPIKVISHIIIEGRYYYKKGLIAVLSNGEEQEKAALSIIYSMEDYIRLKLTSGFEFTYTVPKYEELAIEKKHMDIITEFLKHKLRASELDGDDKNERVIKLDSFVTRNQEDSNLLKVFTPKTKIKTTEFYYKDFQGKKQKLAINQQGKIFSTVFLEKEAFEGIVELVYLVQNCSVMKEFLVPAEVFIEEYCSFVHKDMLQEARERQKILICNELKDLVEYSILLHYGEKYCCSIVYLNTIMNVLINICRENIILQENMDIEESQYSILIEFLQLYLRKKHNVNLSIQDIGFKLNIIDRLISITDMDECKLIEAVKKTILVVKKTIDIVHFVS